MADKEKLGAFLKEVSNWDWLEFVKAEHDETYSTNDSIIFAIVRACAMEKMDAIKIALNRIDGKLVTPVNVIFPKIFYTYPKATMIEGSEQIISSVLPAKITDETPDYTPPKSEAVEGEIIEPENPGEWVNEDDYADLPSLSLRQTLVKMSDTPRHVPVEIIEASEMVEQNQRGQAVALPPHVPAVKSVIAAHLLKMAQRRDINAFYEVFDQIDGKLVETIQLLGADVHIPMYSLTAPAGAYRNENGVLQIEATQAQELWTRKLKEELKK